VALKGDVPIARGLGSSVTARLGVILGLARLCEVELTKLQLLNLITALEHHPDNAAPAIFGGFTVAGMAGDHVRVLSFRVAPLLRFVTLIPDFEVSTEQARKLVPGQFSKADTIHNLNRAAFISAAFASRNYAALRGLFEDRLHQPYRQQLIPQLSTVIAAGESAGAIGGWLSGSGSTIMCMALENVDEVARAMQAQLPNSVVKILKADNKGCHVT
jgi:homoserine kinase